MLLVEEDSGDFQVGAAILHNAPDQARHIAPTDIMHSRIYCIVLDDAGNDVGEIEPDFAAAPAPSVP
jgi:hypothetical protein